VQFRVGIGVETIPGAAFPVKVFQARVAVAVEAGAQIDQAFWPPDQASQDIGGKGIDGKDGRKAVGRDYALSFAGADGGVVNDSFEGAEFVRAGGDGFGFRDAAEVAGNGVSRAGGGGQGFFGALGAAGVEDDVVAPGDK